MRLHCGWPIKGLEDELLVALFIHQWKEFLSFVNYPVPCSLAIYKYDKGDYSHALAGAKFRIRYADPGVSAQVWEETTKADGTITIDPLPAAGTLVIGELEAPPGFEIGEVSSQFVAMENVWRRVGLRHRWLDRRDL
ncbi:prealbumin-like fold domain-containing protein [Anaerotruncus colihominis]|uniref:prealbumin-like fold domain-containing protein n=1 Tax=Anaerotruncus colihominis TaxID=169435 RepID=UPI0034E93A2B